MMAWFTGAYMRHMASNYYNASPVTWYKMIVKPKGENRLNRIINISMANTKLNLVIFNVFDN